MKSLSSDLILKRSANYSVSLHTDGTVTLFLPNRVVELSEHALPLLSLFSRPCRVERAFDILAPTVKSGEDWVAVRDTLAELWRNGLLTAVDPLHPQSLHPDKYADPGGHTRLIDDRSRTDAIIEAVREVVQPGDRVIDVGTRISDHAAAIQKTRRNSPVARYLQRINLFHRIQSPEGNWSQITWWTLLLCTIRFRTRRCN